MTNQPAGSMEAPPLRERLRTDLRTALKTRDSAAARMIRTLLGAIDNAEAVDMADAPPAIHGWNPDVPRRVLTEAAMEAIIAAEARACQAALRLYEDLGQAAAAEQVRSELAVIAPYLDGTSPAAVIDAGTI